MTTKPVNVRPYVKKTGKAVDSHTRKNPRIDAKKADFNRLKPAAWSVDDFPSDKIGYDSEKGEGWIVNCEGTKLWVGPGADLERRNLSGLDLRKANLKEANLREANLSKTELTGANLSGVDATNASFTEASLRYIDMRRSNLEGANLANVVMRYAVVKDTQAKGAKISRSVFDNVDFSNTDLSSIECEGATFTRVDFTNAEMEGTAFKDCVIQGIFRLSYSSGLNFASCDLTGSDFSDTEWYNLRLLKTDAIDTNFSNAVFNSVTFNYTDFTGSVFENVDCDEALFDTCDLRGVYWGGAKTSSMRVSSDKSLMQPKPRLAKYDVSSFEDAIRQMKLTKNQFEFLVTSRAIEVRDEKGEIVLSGFNPSLHRIPQWAIDNYLYRNETASTDD